jgi:hypothetical protein
MMHRQTHVEYITFYLGEMEEHLRLEKSLHNSENLLQITSKSLGTD